MKFDLRFIITLVLIVLIIISFVFIILETLHYNSNAGKLAFQTTGTTSADKNIDDLQKDDEVKVKTVGPSPTKLVADTQYYRYGSLVIHVLVIISGAYLVYTN